MRISGQERIAEVFGVAPKTIVEWQEQGFPIAVRGGPGVASEYDTAQCIQWFSDRAVRKVANETPRDRLARLQADSIEMDNAIKRGTLIPADRMEPRLVAVAISAREMFLGGITNLASRMVGLDQAGREDILREHFEGFLRRLARWVAPQQDEPLPDAPGAPEAEP